jgi:hypothetical protein
MRQRLYIIPQRYPTHDGQRPLSFAIYRGRTFLAYSWSLSGAWIALQVIRQSVTQSGLFAMVGGGE